MIRKVITTFLFLLLTSGTSLKAGDVVTRWASGEVMAIDIKAAPNTIVVKSKTWRGQDFIIGAAVEDGAMIMVGNNRVQLKDIRIGDMVDITYERNLRVIAKTIQIKRR